MRKPFFSIIVINFNSPFLKRTLNSLQKQTFKNWEVILVDNYSDYNVKKIVYEMNDKRFKLYFIHNKGKMAKSRNLGIKKSKSNLVCFCDSDDWWIEDKLLRLYEEYKKKKSDIIYHNMVVVDNVKKREIKKKSKNYKNDFFLNCLKYGNPIKCSSLMIKKKIIKKVGYFSLDKKVDNGWIDLDLILKCSKITKRIHLIDKYLGYYWIGSNNYSSDSNIRKSMKNFNEIYIKNNKYFENKYPWWSTALEVKKNFQSKKNNKVIKLLKKIKCYTFYDSIKFFYYYFRCNY